MPKSVNQKQKLLFLLDYLRQNTDETHTVTTPQIIDHLAANGIRAERKSIFLPESMTAGRCWRFALKVWRLPFGW